MNAKVRKVTGIIIGVIIVILAIGVLIPKVFIKGPSCVEPYDCKGLNKIIAPDSFWERLLIMKVVVIESTRNESKIEAYTLFGIKYKSMIIIRDFFTP